MKGFLFSGHPTPVLSSVFVFRPKLIKSFPGRPVWQGFTTDCLKFHPGPLYLSFLRLRPSSSPFDTPRRMGLFLGVALISKILFFVGTLSLFYKNDTFSPKPS
jgi:hypothetical protein